MVIKGKYEKMVERGGILPVGFKGRVISAQDEFQIPAGVLNVHTTGSDENDTKLVSDILTLPKDAILLNLRAAFEKTIANTKLQFRLEGGTGLIGTDGLSVGAGQTNIMHVYPAFTALNVNPFWIPNTKTQRILGVFTSTSNANITLSVGLYIRIEMEFVQIG